MGSDMGHSMYYTEAEPPIEIIGRKKHFFGKPNQKGQSQGNLSVIRQDEVINTGTNEQQPISSEI
jgi:hypothetical protein